MANFQHKTEDKLIILYVLNKIKTGLSREQLAYIIVQNLQMRYIDIQVDIDELIGEDLIHDESADAVVLMTIHSAKGLEFPVVFLPGMEEGVFPSQQTMEGGTAELEEERRLAYVALTRAKRELYLLHTSMRLLYGRTCINPVSRFVSEIPQDLLQKEEPDRDRMAAEGAFRAWGTVSPAANRPRTYFRAEDEKPRKPSYGGQTAAGFPAPRKPAVPAEILPAGARVRHATFGEGVILSAKAMGADTLYEIMFDTAGTKKLMASYARLTRLG